MARGFISGMVWGLVVSGVGGAAASLVAGNAGKGIEAPMAKVPEVSAITAPAEEVVTQPDAETMADDTAALAATNSTVSVSDPDPANQPAQSEMAIEDVPEAVGNEAVEVVEPELAAAEELSAEQPETMAPEAETTPEATDAVEEETGLAVSEEPETMAQDAVEPVTEPVAADPVAEPVEETVMQPEAAEESIEDVTEPVTPEMVETPVEETVVAEAEEATMSKTGTNAVPVEEAMQEEIAPQIEEEPTASEMAEGMKEETDSEMAALADTEAEPPVEMVPADEDAEVVEPEMTPQEAVPEVVEAPVSEMTEETKVTEQPAPEAAAPETEVAALPQIISPRDTPEPDATPQPEPKPGLGNSTPKVQINRLPTIGGTTAPEEPQTEASVNDAQDAKTALEAFAMPFENPDAKPTLSVVLIDNPDTPVSDDALAHLPFALSFAIDAAREDAGQVAARYRKAGFEVLMMTNLPQGASASDVEVAFEAYSKEIPEAVAVLDRGATSKEATQIAGILADRGLGLITPSKGLNSAQKAAQREGVPAALIYRELDSAGETVPAIRQYLNRAAFRAAQEGSVIMLGHTRPETIEALVLWALEDRAASVAIAPVSAVLKGG